MLRTTLKTQIKQAQMTGETGGWIDVRATQTEMDADPSDLLAQPNGPRLGNLRFALRRGTAVLCGELRDADGLLDTEEVRRRLLLGASETSEIPSPEEVECALGEVPFEWARLDDRADLWQSVVSNPSDRVCELTAAIVDGGVEVRGRLAEWETALREAPRRALARFLLLAHGRLRGVRFVLDEQGVDATSFAATDRLEIELPTALDAVAAACRRVSREVQTLAHEAVAREYLESLGESPP